MECSQRNNVVKNEADFSSEVPNSEQLMLLLFGGVKPLMKHVARQSFWYDFLHASKYNVVISTVCFNEKLREHSFVFLTTLCQHTFVAFESCLPRV